MATKREIIMFRNTITACAMAAAVAMAGSATAQQYPVDTVTLITHSSPGGGSDVFLREMSNYLAPILGANVIVENVKGGSGAKAMADLAQAPADGSRFYATTPTFIYTSLLSDPEYTYSDLMPLVNFFIDPEVIFTAAGSEFETLEQVIDAARADRGRWGAANPASLERQALEQLKTAAGVEAGIVTHEGGGDMMINVLNGTLEIGVGEVQELKSQLEAGKIRLLATFSGQRLDQYPDMPTVQELGYDVVVRKFRGLAAPMGTPDNIIAAWETAAQAVLADPEYKAKYEANNLRPEFIAHAEYVEFIQTFANETEGFLKDNGIIE
jgi:putative tricarboxylic transport membrane protein